MTEKEFHLKQELHWWKYWIALPLLLIIIYLFCLGFRQPSNNWPSDLPEGYEHKYDALDPPY